MRRTEDFEVTRDGQVIVFPSSLSLTGFTNNGKRLIYRYDEPADSLVCASCAPTGARSENDASLPHDGWGLSDDGRVFFTTADPLDPRDLNGGNLDVYEWSPATGPALISTGISPFDSRLLSVTRNGTDVAFFTHDVLTAGDRNGNLTKIYDAREKGGFYVQQVAPPCKASDECHGPGTQSAGPPDIGTYKGVGGQATTPSASPRRCRAGQVKRRGRCVKRHQRRRGKHQKQQHRAPDPPQWLEERR